MDGVLVLREGARTPSERCQGTLEQITEPTNAHIRNCDELLTNQEWTLPSPNVHPRRNPDGDKAVKKTRQDEIYTHICNHI